MDLPSRQDPHLPLNTPVQASPISNCCHILCPLQARGAPEMMPWGTSFNRWLTGGSAHKHPSLLALQVRKSASCSMRCPSSPGRSEHIPWLLFLPSLTFASIPCTAWNYFPHPPLTFASSSPVFWGNPNNTWADLPWSWRSIRIRTRHWKGPRIAVTRSYIFVKFATKDHFIFLMNVPNVCIISQNLDPLLIIWFSIYTIHLFIIICLPSLECKLRGGRTFSRFVHYWMNLQ